MSLDSVLLIEYYDLGYLSPININLQLYYPQVQSPAKFVNFSNEIDDVYFSLQWMVVQQFGLLFVLKELNYQPTVCLIVVLIYLIFKNKLNLTFPENFSLNECGCQVTSSGQVSEKNHDSNLFMRKIIQCFVTKELQS